MSEPLPVDTLTAIEARSAVATEARAAITANIAACGERWASAVRVLADAEHASAADVPTLVDEVHRLRSEVAAYGVALGESRGTIADACNAAVAAERERCLTACRDIYARFDDAVMEGGGDVTLPDDSGGTFDVRVDDETACYAIDAVQACINAIRGPKGGDP